jgi:26 proteasome complex subunit DSS1
MSAAPASGAAPAAKGTTTDKNAELAKDTKPAAALEEDDEFEDFPVESTLTPCSACWGRISS